MRVDKGERISFEEFREYRRSVRTPIGPPPNVRSAQFELDFDQAMRQVLRFCLQEGEGISGVRLTKKKWSQAVMLAYRRLSHTYFRYAL